MNPQIDELFGGGVQARILSAARELQAHAADRHGKECSSSESHSHGLQLRAELRIGLELKASRSPAPGKLALAQQAAGILYVFEFGRPPFSMVSRESPWKLTKRTSVLVDQWLPGFHRSTVKCTMPGEALCLSFHSWRGDWSGAWPVAMSTAINAPPTMIAIEEDSCP